MVLMIGERPAAETSHYAVNEVAARYGASAGKESHDPNEAYADWPGDYLPWPLAPDANA